MQEIFSVIYFAFMVCKLLLPIWVMLFVFQPTPQVQVESDDLIPALTDDGNSAFSTNTDEQYRQLYHPGENYSSLAYDSPSAYSPSGYSQNGINSPRGNFNTIVNGVANNIYRNSSPQTNNLGAIREENVPISQNSSLKNPAEHDLSVKESVSNGKGKQSVDAANKGLPASAESRPTSVTPSAVVLPSGEKIQSKNNKTVSSTNQVQKAEKAVDKNPPTQVVVNKKEGGPKFSIQSDDSGDESPPKGKFYI